jgi:hypothetical protein
MYKDSPLDMIESSFNYKPLSCVHCGLYRREHLDDKRCLFSPTEFLSHYQHRRNQQNSHAPTKP